MVGIVLKYPIQGVNGSRDNIISTMCSLGQEELKDKKRVLEITLIKTCIQLPYFLG